MFEGIIPHKKKEETEYIVSLALLDYQVSGALWYLDSDKKVVVVKTAQAVLSDAELGLISSSDHVISQLEEQLPPGVTISKVVFGLMPESLENEVIKPAVLTHLKDMTSKLALNPFGFVELPSALTYYLQVTEGSAQTAIVVGIEKKYVTVSLFKVGNFVGTKQIERSSEIALDIEKGLVSFSVEVFPSRIILYGGPDSLESLQETLLQHPWQTRAHFLHIPKIEHIDALLLSSAVAYGAAHDLATKIVHEQSPVTVPEPAITQDDVVPVDPESLGFASTTPPSDLVVDSPPDEPPVSSPISKMQGVVASVFDRVKNVSETLPNVAIPQGKRLGALMMVVLFLFLGACMGGLYWFVPQARITLLVTPKEAVKEETVTIVADEKSDVKSGIVISTRKVTAQVAGDTTITTTGKKQVGDKAKGEVVITNKTPNTKTFKKGTILNAKNLAFALDDDVSVPAASESGDLKSLVYGSKKAGLVGLAIGEEGNFSAGVDFTFKEFPTTSYSARNDSALSGGSSREVTVVARSDWDEITRTLLEKLKQEALVQLSQKIDPTQEVIIESLLAQKIDKDFSKEVGEEAGEVKGAFTSSYEALTYNKKDILASLSLTDISREEGYEVRADETKVAIVSMEKEKTGETHARARFTFKLYPVLDTSYVVSHIAGLSYDQMKEIVSNNAGVVGIEIGMVRRLPFLNERLPANPHNIELVIKSP